MSDYMMAIGFHGYADTALATIAKEFIRPKFPGPRPSRVETRHIIVRERNLSYAFSPHYHPYVGDLTRRLLTGSTRGLQAVDTEYRTRVTVTADAQALDDGPVTIATGEEVWLADGIGLTVASQPARLAGRHVVSADGLPLGVRV